MTANLKLAPSPQQPLNGQGVRRISGFKLNHKIRLGTWNVGSFRGRGTEVCEELRRRDVDVCCMQEVRWKGQGARFVGVRDRRFKLWWSGSESGNGGVGILVKEELCDKVVEVRRKSERVMAMVLIFNKELIRVISAYGPQSGRAIDEKVKFYDEMAYEWSICNKNELVFGLGDFNGHIGKNIDGFEGVHGGNGFGERNSEGRMLLEFCDEKELCIANTWYKKPDKRKITFRSGKNESEIDFILVGKTNRKYLRDVKVIPGELQHGMVVTDFIKRDVKKIIKRERIVRRKIWKLKEKDIQKKFEKRVEELVNIEASDLWSSFKDGLLKACDELCGKKIVRRNRGDTWWWNEEVSDAVTEKKKAYKELCKNRTEENMAKYRKKRNITKKVISKAMQKEAEKEIEDLHRHPNKVFKLVKIIKKDGKDVDGGKCIRSEDGKLAFSESDRRQVWKEHMEKIMNIENAWDQLTEAEVVEGPIESVTRREVAEAIQKMKPGKAAGSSEINTELIKSSGNVGITVMTELCQRILDGKGMPAEWKTSVVVPIFKGKGDVMNCGAYRGVKLLEHGMKIVERVLENRMRTLVELDKMQFGFMPGKGTTDALFIVRRMQEEYLDKSKRLYMCFVDMEKAFDRVPRRVMEWAMRKKGLPEILVRAVMSLYESAKTRVRVEWGLSEEFPVSVGVHQGSVLSPLLFAMVIDTVTENVREGSLHEILYADDVVLTDDTLEDLQARFGVWKSAFESKGMKVNIGKTRMMVSGTEGEVVKSRVDPCGVCGRRVMANSMQCEKCQRWVHGKCAKVRRVTSSMAKGFTCRNCKAILGGKVSLTEKLCDGVETAKGFCYLGDRLNASGGCASAVTARIRIGWVKFRECGEMLCGRRYSMKIKGRIYRSCIRSAMLYGSETWCLTGKEVEALKRTERAMVRAMCGAKLMEKKKTDDLMNMLGLKDTLYGLARASAVWWYGHVLRRDEDDILKKALDFKVEGKRGRGRPKKMWRKQVDDDIRKAGLKPEDAFDRKRWKERAKLLAVR